MLVSHESPLVLLNESRSYNDYDYALVHLLPLYPEYLKFFIESKKMGRKILLDNSMFELREAFVPVEYAKWIEELKPDEYIIPDVFNNTNKTIENFEKWKTEFNNLPGKKIGVIQGTTFQDMINCYRYMSINADKIAISFESAYFTAIGYSLDNNATIWERIMNGRQSFIKDLITEQIWAWHKPHHALGCALPQEFRFYNENLGAFNIESIDTSNPIVAGMHDIVYNNYGLKDKLTIKLADIFEQEVTEKHKEIILSNIKKFREINKIERK